MSFAVRVATPEDFQAIGELTVAAYRGDGQTWSGHAYEAVLLDVAGRSGAGTLLVCACAEGILGAVLFVEAGSEYSELAREGEAEFRMLAVAPWAQRRGVGEALTCACLERARGLGCHSVVICVRNFATDAQRLYKRMGFVREPSLDWSPTEHEGVLLLGLRYDLTSSRS
jgi:ribosomal protein S18 acetylase RimI-like enzyme